MELSWNFKRGGCRGCLVGLRKYGCFRQSLHISLLSYVNKVFSPE